MKRGFHLAALATVLLSGVLATSGAGQVYPVRLDEERLVTESATATPPSLVLSDGGLEFPDGSVQTTASAAPLVVVDSTGAVVGRVFSFGSISASVIRDESGSHLLLGVFPKKLEGFYNSLLYTSTDCTGTPFIATDGAVLWNSLVITVLREGNYYRPVSGASETTMDFYSAWRTSQGCEDFGGALDYLATQAEVIPGLTLTFTPDFELRGGPFAE